MRRTNGCLVPDVEISYNTIDTVGNATMGISVGAAGATGLTVSNNEFTAEDGDGSFWCPDGVNVSVSNNTFTGPASPTSGYAVEFSGVTGTSTISGNTITNYANGVFVFAAAPGCGTTAVSGLTISGNTLSGCINGIRLGHSSQTLDVDVTVTGNTISGCEKGIYFAPNDTHADMASNIFADNTYNIYHAAEIMTGGSDFYGNINDAMANAGPGDTITVYAGTYSEYVYIDKSLTLQSDAGPDETVVNGYVKMYLGWDGEDELAETVIFDGFDVSTEFWVAIWLDEVNNGSSVTINDCIVHDTDDYGIYCGEDTLDNGSTVAITDNEIYDCYNHGIWFEWVMGGSEVTITGNEIYENDRGDGICIDEVYDSTVTIGGDTPAEGNEIYWNGGDSYWGRDGIDIGYLEGSSLSILNNDIYENYDVGIQIDEADEDSTVVINYNIIAYNTNQGIRAGYMEAEVTITGNEIYDNERGDGIYIDCMEDAIVTIEDNEICDNGWDSYWGRDGIEAYSVINSSLSILNNDILDNHDVGIQIVSADADSSVVINYNSIAGNYNYGLRVDSSDIVVDATCNWWGDVAGPYDDGGNSYYNPCNDWTQGDDLYGDVDYTPWLIQSDLAEDWNIWSRPIAPGEDSWVQMQAELTEDGMEAIYYFDSATQLWGTDPDEAGALDAFYIKMPDDSRIRYCISDEATFPGQKTMKVGWNLIGLADLHAGKGLEDTLLDAYWGTGQTELWGYSKVISPFLNEDSWYYQRDLDQPHPLFTTKGYWVFMVNDGVLSGFTETPIVEESQPQ